MINLKKITFSRELYKVLTTYTVIVLLKTAVLYVTISTFIYFIPTHLHVISVITGQFKTFQIL